MAWHVVSRTLAVVFLCIGAAGAPVEPLRLALVGIVALPFFFVTRKQTATAIAVSLFAVAALGSYVQHDAMPLPLRFVPAAAVAFVFARTRNDDGTLALAAVCGAALLFLA